MKLAVYNIVVIRARALTFPAGIAALPTCLIPPGCCLVRDSPTSIQSNAGDTDTSRGSQSRGRPGNPSDYVGLARTTGSLARGISILDIVVIFVV